MPSSQAPRPRHVAYTYLSRGWAPIPVPARAKNPNRPGWQRLRPTLGDLPTLFPDAPQNVGVLLGEPSGELVDVDLDTPEARALADQFLPATGAIFGRRSAPGAHRLYVVAGAGQTRRWRDPTQQKGDKRATLQELRATGAQTLFPGSIHPSGEAITWVAEGDPSVISLTDLVPDLDRLAAAALLARHWPAPGSRHDAALALAGGLLHADWTPEAVHAFVVAVAEAAGDEEVTDRERAVTSTHQAMHGSRPTTGWPTLARLTDPRVVDAVTTWLGIEQQVGHTTANASYEAFGSGVAERPAPELIARAIPVPPFPLHVFPPLVRRFLEDGAAAVGCPPDLLAVPFLGYAAAAIGRTRRLALKRGWVRRATFWAGVVAASGDGKSPADAYVRAPLDRLQAEADARFQEQYAAFKQDQGRWKSEDPKTRREEPSPPLYEHWYTTDPTVEALAPMLQTNPGLAAAFDELTAWARGCNSYKRGGNDRQKYLELWNGRPLKVDRKTQGVIYVPDPVLCIIGGIQPERLPELTREASVHDGLLPRFGWTYPDVTPSGWDWDDAEADHLEAMVALFRALRRTPSPIGSLVLQPHPTAREQWASWYNANTQERASLPPLAREFASKLPAQLATLWLVLSAMWAPEDSSGVASAQRLQGAIEVVEYFRAHARRVLAHFGTTAPAGDVGVIERIRSLLEQAGTKGRSRTELSNALHRNVPADALDAALGALAAQGVAECWEQGTVTNTQTRWRIRHVTVSNDANDAFDDWSDEETNSSYEEFDVPSPHRPRQCYACGSEAFASTGVCLVCHPQSGPSAKEATR